MNTRRLLALIALPVVIGTFGCVAQNRATAQSPNRLAQSSSQPNQQQEGRRNHRGPDFAAAAKLGITEQQLVDALGVPPHPPRPDFAAAAQKLGVSEADLKTALGVPENPPSTPPAPGERPPRPDFKAAAAKLGVTEQQLMDALGKPPHPPEDGNQPNESSPPQQ